MSRFPFPMPTPRRTRTRRPVFGSGRGGGGLKMRLLIAAGIALFALISYFGNSGDVNQITGKRERVAMTEEVEEIQLGLQAAPEMVKQHKGVSRNRAAFEHVAQIGGHLVAALEDALARNGKTNPYGDAFEFTLLADQQTVNAFALPGGKIFITAALYRDIETEGQLAGVLGHEIGHVIERHGNKRMAKQVLFQGLAAAGGVAGGSTQSAQMAQMVTQMMSMKYGRDDELESDRWGVKLTAMAGYDPRAMIGLMKVLERASKGQAPPEIMSTHPKPANRVAYIERVIKSEFPNGVPKGLRP